MPIDLESLRQAARNATPAGGPSMGPIDVAAVAAHHDAALMRLVGLAHHATRDELVRANRDARIGAVVDPAILRDREAARRDHDQARVMFWKAQQPVPALDLQRSAFASDPFDVEVAGGLALYALACDRVDEARATAIYAICLRRPADGIGRVIDWMTLAAALAAAGDTERATYVLILTLALAPDPQARCAGAASAVRNVYGPLLLGPCLAMFERAEAWGLGRPRTSDATRLLSS